MARIFLSIAATALALMWFGCFAKAADTYTINYKFRLPDLETEDPETPWGEKYNNNFVLVDAAIDSISQSTQSAAAGITTLQVSTGALKTQADAIAVSTGATQSSLAAVILSTGALKTQADAIAVSTGAIQSSLAAVILSTGQIQASLSQVIISTGQIVAGTVLLQATQTFSGANTFIGTDGSLPNFTGMFSFFVSASSTCPMGWIYPKGQSLSTTTYSALFGIMAYNYGGSGANFTMPNMEAGEFVRAIGGNAGSMNAIQLDALKSHTHSYSFKGPTTGGTTAGGDPNSVGTQGETTGDASTGASAETRPRNYAMIPCIKY